jgi:hypothetical protein
MNVDRLMAASTVRDPSLALCKNSDKQENNFVNVRQSGTKQAAGTRDIQREDLSGDD